MSHVYYNNLPVVFLDELRVFDSAIYSSFKGVSLLFKGSASWFPEHEDRNELTVQ